MGQFVGCVRGIAEACKALDFPVVSGNVSLYNETNGRAILPTPTIGGVGLLDDFTQVARSLPSRRRRGHPADRRDARLARPVALSARYLRPRGGRAAAGRSAVEKRERRFRPRADRRGQVTAAHDISDGGLLVALAEMAMASGSARKLDAAPETAAARFLVRRGSGALCRDGRRPRPPTPCWRAAKAAAFPRQSSVRRRRQCTDRSGRKAGSEVAALVQGFEGWLPAYMAGAA